MKPQKVRLDQLLVMNGLVENPSKARSLIMAGNVLINEQKVDKAGQKFNSDTANIRIKSNEHNFVSRGALKLLHALKTWPLDITNMTAIDVGASTGGFSEVLLQAKAAKVYAIDVGYNQLDLKLRQDKRIVSMEKTHILHVDKSNFTEEIKIAVIEVSFISLEKILAKVKHLLADNSRIYALIKPQFEVGRELIAKGGIVKDPQAHEWAVEKIKNVALTLDLEILGVEESPIFGTKGNKEFLIGLLKKPT